VFNNKTFSWQFGPSVQLGNNWQFGLQYQKSFTPLAKAYVNPKLYWQHINIYTAIPIGKKSKQAQKPRF
jgi:hypothetical protein